MRDAIGNTFLYYVVIVFILLAMLVLIGSMSYSKGFKAKNMIVDIIEDNRGYDNYVMLEIDEALRKSGYRPKSAFNNTICPDRGGTLLEESNKYFYCVYSNQTERGTYYSVTIYIRFEVPLISEILQFPVNGDTKTIYDLNV